MIELSKTDELINDYYTPFIKSKYDKKEINYDKELKELDKQLDRIKTAYIKGILSIEDFDKDIKQIEFKKDELTKKLFDEKQYENLSFTVDDLLILRDKQEINNFINPDEFIKNILSWLINHRERKQQIISKYIDNIVIEKKGTKTEIKELNFRESYISDIITYHKEYKLPLNFDLFIDNFGFKIPMNSEIKTSIQAEEYFNKLKETMGSEYTLNYYVMETDEDLSDLGFDTHNEIEKIIRMIAIKDKDKFQESDLKFGAITIDVSNVLDKNGKQLYKNYLETLEKIEGDLNNELCDI